MIPEQYQFSTFTEFYTKRDNISIWYETQPLDKQWCFRYYCYSRVRLEAMRDDDVDCLWNWLNYNMEDKALDHYYKCNGGYDR